MSESSSAEQRPEARIPGEVYLVGGAVRDELLGLPPAERDWVVVGADERAMQALGFRRVGRDFPVFLHPHDGEEYALARRERKSGPGHTGFEVEAHRGITLEQDLMRRDLTINAMARARDGRLIDPFDGAGDLRKRCLRHVSPAFAEDPLRVLRTARFAARFAGRGFSIAPATLALMRAMADSGELAALTPERVWRELSLALETERPSVFFAILADVGALAAVLPELLPQWSRAEAGAASAARLDRAAADALTPVQRFASLCHGLERGAVTALCRRIRAPRRFRELAGLVAVQADSPPKVADAEAALTLLERLDALRRPGRLRDFSAVCASLWPGQGEQLRRLEAARAAAVNVSGEPLREAGFAGKALARALRCARRDAIAARLSAS